MARDFMAHGAPQGLRDWLEISGVDGAIRLEEGRVTHLRGNEVGKEHRADLAADYAASYAAAIGHFLYCKQTGGPYETAPADNLKTLALIERAYTAHSPTPPRDA